MHYSLFLTRPAVNMAVEKTNPDSKVHGANMGPIWGPTGPRWAHVGLRKFVIWGHLVRCHFMYHNYDAVWCLLSTIVKSLGGCKQNKTLCWFVRIVFLSPFIGSLYGVRNNAIYVLCGKLLMCPLQRYFWCYFSRCFTNRGKSPK